MPLIEIPTRTSANVNAAADVNDLMTNCEYLDGEIDTLSGEIADIEDNYIPIDPYLHVHTLTPADSVAIDWTTASKYECTLNRATTTFTFTAPTYPTTLLLRLTQDGTGSRLATFPSAVKWANKTATLTTTANGIDIVNIYYDGSTYYATVLNAFQTL